MPNASFGLFGFHADGTPRMHPVGSKPLSKLKRRFLWVPFSVLNAASGPWQDRKAQWVKWLGIKGEAGRGVDTGVCYGSGDAAMTDPDLNHYRKVEQARRKATPGGSPRPAANYSKNRARGDGTGRPMGVTYAIGDKASWDAEKAGDQNNHQTGTSIFDPVLCELMYRWFCPPGGRILDPFAGESTKGIVGQVLGYQYTGVELRSEQVWENRGQAADIFGGGLNPEPQWVCGDSGRLAKLIPKKPRFDFIFTSPPYYDLEIYSESDKDGSAFETYPIFMDWYKLIFAAAVRRLKRNRFLVVKVGEIRDERGAYRNFVGDNIRVFQELGLTYYNEMILVTAGGSLPIRVGKQFQTSRKIGKTHQNILCFWKGDPADVKEHFRDLSIAIN